MKRTLEESGSGEPQRQRGRYRNPEGSSPQEGPHQPGSSHDEQQGFALDRSSSSRYERDRGQYRGRGRGGGAGRGIDRRKRLEEQFDAVVSRPNNEDGVGMGKKGRAGTSKALVANFFGVEAMPDWQIYHYRVDFVPDEADTRMKKGLFNPHRQSFPGMTIFDGSSLYTSQNLPDNLLEFLSLRQSDQAEVKITLRLVGHLAKTDIMYLQVLNIIVRSALQAMNLEQLPPSRNFYDPKRAIDVPTSRLQLWPGFKTSLRQHENSLLLGVELVYKVLRQDNCLTIMEECQGRDHRFDKEMAKKNLVGNIVVTYYNHKSYRVDDIQWDMTPRDTFDLKGKQTSFMEYYQQRYGLRLRDPHQPMLLSRPTKKAYHRGKPEPLLLIPELCKMTGISDDMRRNFQLMKSIAQHTNVEPNTRVRKLEDFITQLRGTHNVEKELDRWGLKFKNKLVEVQGRVLPREKILFGDNKVVDDYRNSDWSIGARDKPMFSAIPLRKWALLVGSRDAHVVDGVISTMKQVAGAMRFQISEPLTKHRVTGNSPSEFVNAIDKVMNEYKGVIEMIFVILPSADEDVYSAVKKRTCIEFGVPSQCFLAKNAKNDKAIRSICTKLTVQMAAKLGGQPWSIFIPMKNKAVMFVGFDVSRRLKSSGSCFGAMVATTCPENFGKYFSCVSSHSSNTDLSENMGVDFTKCLRNFKKINGNLPSRIIMYRDGVGQGQLQYVHEIELKAIKDALDTMYKSVGSELPALTFIVVTKRISVRIMDREGHRLANPAPGTIVDDVITLPERYDFYLISQQCRQGQGTVSPTSYNILYDKGSTGRKCFSPDQMQQLTYKLCHAYFNWNGTVSVPAPCQYAKKLAYITSNSLGGACHERLSNHLYFL